MTHYNKIAGLNVKRVEALSDGVFAIALTILVLEIKVPAVENVHSESELFATLKPLLPKFLSYFMSFMTMGIFWTGQAAQFNFIERYDRNLNWMTLFFLLVISLFPFSTAFLGEHIHFKLAIAIYWLNIFLAGVLIYIHWDYASTHKYLSIDGMEWETVNHAIKKRVIIAQSLYLFGALLCFISTYISIIFIIAVQLNYAFAFFSGRRRIKKTARPAQEE